MPHAKILFGILSVFDRGERRPYTGRPRRYGARSWAGGASAAASDKSFGWGTERFRLFDIVKWEEKRGRRSVDSGVHASVASIWRSGFRPVFAYDGTRQFVCARLSLPVADAAFGPKKRRQAILT